ncbi:MAG: alpha-glucosidase [Clostridiales bacterium]|nr:alpha-glucosidase [Clostridiales bacterium]
MEKKWYRTMSVYQIWTRSFCDSNGDGIGDLPGVLSKLDYIESLGVNGIWFSPIYPTPNADYGYDISDYMNINPEFGTLEDFKKILDEAHKRGMKVFMDLVINHTSDEHEWFKESSKSADNPYSDYYIWRKGRGKKKPNNWLSVFEGSAWEYNKNRDEYYLHVFAKKQPDLNMDNPKVRDEVKKIMRFWLDMGVDGFREDVITFISKAEGLPNGFPLPVATGVEHYKHGPHLEEYLREFRDVQNEYDCFAVGEGPMTSVKDAVKFCTEGKDKLLDMMISFDHMNADCFMADWVKTPFNLRKLKSAMSTWQNEMYGKGWNCLYIENHDHARVIDRYGSPKYRRESGKMLAAMYLLQWGTPFIYQGQEIGMGNIRLDRVGDYKDVLTFNNYRLFSKLLHYSDEKFLDLAAKVSRENARTPVQWNSEKNAGFTTGEPWFKVNENYREINVEAQENDPDSLLNFYRKLIAYRRGNDLVVYGKYKEYYHSSSDLYVYERKRKNERLLVICSFREKPVKFKAPVNYDLSRGEVVFSNYKDCPIDGNGFVTKPYEVRVYHFMDNN